MDGYGTGTELVVEAARAVAAGGIDTAGKLLEAAGPGAPASRVLRAAADDVGDLPDDAGQALAVVCQQLAWQALRLGLGEQHEALVAALARADPSAARPAWTTSGAGPRSAPPWGVSAVAFASAGDGRLLLAVGGEGGVRLQDARDGRPPGIDLAGPGEQVTSLAAATDPDGVPLLAAGCASGVLHLWNVRAGGPAWLVEVPRCSHVTSVALAATGDGRLLLAAGGSRRSTTGTVRLWQLPGGKPTGSPLSGPADEVTSLAFATAGDGRLLLAAGSRAGTVHLWDALTRRALGEPLSVRAGPLGRVDAVAFGATGSGRLLLAAGGGMLGGLHVWDALTGQPMDGPHGLEALLSTASVALGAAGDGRLLLASTGQHGTVRLSDPLDGQRVGVPLRVPGGPAHRLAWAPDQGGALLAVATQTDAYVWQVPPPSAHDAPPSG